MPTAATCWASASAPPGKRQLTSAPRADNFSILSSSTPSILRRRLRIACQCRKPLNLTCITMRAPPMSPCQPAMGASSCVFVCHGKTSCFSTSTGGRRTNCGLIRSNFTLCSKSPKATSAAMSAAPIALPSGIR